jgi:hypothetical protein
MALIAQYLLHLAANPFANRLHIRSAQDADDQMRAFGLDEKQRAVIATCDRQKISEALAAELPQSEDPRKAMTFEFTGGVITPPMMSPPRH